MEEDTEVVGSIEDTIEEQLARLQNENKLLRQNLESGGLLLEESIASDSTDGAFTAHYNPVTEKTMWTSADGRKSFVTTTKTQSQHLGP